MKSFSGNSGWIQKGLISLAVIGIFSLALNIYLFSKASHLKQTLDENAKPNATSSLDVLREKSSPGELAQPLLLADISTESDRFAGIKAEINTIIQQRKQAGIIQDVSVYLRDLNTASWTLIGDDKEYYPGSLMKVPIMLYYLKLEQDSPGTLNKELLYQRPDGKFPEQNILGDSIVSGRKYTVATLMRYMIVESDNHANYVLSTHIDQTRYRKLFADLDIPYNEITNVKYSISPKQYSKFLRVIYNGTYLNEQLSNYALTLLSKCRFDDGLVKDLPSGTIVAHKFGERGFDRASIDFSESGIIYFNDHPYLLTIMTRGSDIKQQTALVRELSAQIYNQYKNI